MTGNEYQLKAARTINDCMWDQEKFRHALFGLTAENGEINSILQKMYQRKSNEHEDVYLSHDALVHLKSELGDLLWFAAELCTACGWLMDDVMEENIEKLRKRYPDKYDVEHDIHRKEGDF